MWIDSLLERLEIPKLQYVIIPAELATFSLGKKEIHRSSYPMMPAGENALLNLIRLEADSSVQFKLNVLLVVHPKPDAIYWSLVGFIKRPPSIQGYLIAERPGVVSKIRLAVVNKEST